MTGHRSRTNIRQALAIYAMFVIDRGPYLFDFETGTQGTWTPGVRAQKRPMRFKTPVHTEARLAAGHPEANGSCHHCPDSDFVREDSGIPWARPRT